MSNRRRNNKKKGSRNKKNSNNNNNNNGGFGNNNNNNNAGGFGNNNQGGFKSNNQGGGFNNNNNNNNNNNGFNNNNNNKGGYKGKNYNRNNRNNNRNRGGNNNNGGRGGGGKLPADVKLLNQTRIGHCPAPQSPQDQQKCGNFAVRACFFDETKQQLLTTGNDMSVKMWNLQGQPVGSVKVPGIGWSLHMAGPFLFVGCEVQTGQTNPATQGLIQAFNTTSNESWQLKMSDTVPWSHGTRVSALVTHGQFVFSGGGCWPQEQNKAADNDIRVWQMNPQTKQFAMASAMKGHTSAIMSMCLSSDTKFLISGDMQGKFLMLCCSFC